MSTDATNPTTTVAEDVTTTSSSNNRGWREAIDRLQQNVQSLKSDSETLDHASVKSTLSNVMDTNAFIESLEVELQKHKGDRSFDEQNHAKDTLELMKKLCIATTTEGLDPWLRTFVRDLDIATRGVLEDPSVFPERQHAPVAAFSTATGATVRPQLRLMTESKASQADAVAKANLVSPSGTGQSSSSQAATSPLTDDVFSPSSLALSPPPKSPATAAMPPPPLPSRSSGQQKFFSPWPVTPGPPSVAEQRRAWTLLQTSTAMRPQAHIEDHKLASNPSAAVTTSEGSASGGHDGDREHRAKRARLDKKESEGQ